MGDATPSQRRAECEAIALASAKLIRSRFGDPGRVRDKGTPEQLQRHLDLVTEVDHLSERLVLEGIAAISPHALVLAEEGGLLRVDGTAVPDTDPAQADEVWLVDPLDGTINFAHGIPHFCVSVACWRRGAPFAGAIVDPMVQETFSFEWDDADSGTDRAAFHNGDPIELGDGGPPARSVLYVGGGGPALAPLMRRFQSWRRLGSAALALAWTGAGRCGAYVQAGQLHPWDWGVGAPFIEAAGGVVTDGGGQTWNPKLGGTTGMIVAPSGIHAEIADMAAAAGASG